MIFWRNAYRVLSRTFDYSGRSSRAELWWWMRLLFCALLVSFAAFVVEHTLLVRSLPNLSTLLGTLLIASVLVAVLGFLPTLALVVRRLHDTGRSGGAVVVWFVAPLFAWIVFLGIAFVTFSIALVGGDTSVVPFYSSLGVAIAVTLAVACWAIWWLQQEGNDGPNPFGDVPR